MTDHLLQSEPPESPAEQAWPFEAELQRPMHSPLPFPTGAPPGPDELDLRQGVSLDWQFPDPHGLLATMQADFIAFCDSIGLGISGTIPLVTRLADIPGQLADTGRETYQIQVREADIVVAAGDTEGIRRGLIHLEELLLTRAHYALPRGLSEHQAFIRTRLSRCVYGPINRPPLCRDELVDERDYYPDGYLNRLAHHGINGLWITVRFTELLPSRILPELGAKSPHRLETLRRVVAQCARYGIRIYPFCIEPAALPLDHPVLQAHPELRGADAPGDRALFCTSSAIGRAYIEEAASTLFREVPGLGGLLCIPVGERFTHCYSGWPEINCPRCASRQPWEVLADTLAAFEHGMHAVDPDAELIAWPYGQYTVWGPELAVEAAKHLPPRVALQQNFEYGGEVEQLGKLRPLRDYWLSWVGPSRFYAACAEAARINGTRMFAKVQTSCSHEVATTQVVPVPGLLYRKYRRMRELGISGVMQGWYFGNYPSVMTRASGRLSFAPLPETEEAFLQDLAAPVWGRHTALVVQAWQHFADGYTQYPGAQVFSYYGPMHDGVVWPLYLVPHHLPLAPTWRIVHPPSGDQMSECVSPAFTYGEVLELCQRLRDHWRQGTAILGKLAEAEALSAECRREINVAKALGIQFDSAYNILCFYKLRDELAVVRTSDEQRSLLHRLEKLVEEEIANSRELLTLCETNPTLGFHSEAEGYKYFPSKLRWRIGLLQTLLSKEFPRVAEQTGAFPMPAFQGYIGEGEGVLAYRGQWDPSESSLAREPFAAAWDKLPVASCSYWAGPLASEAQRPFPFQSTLHPLAQPESPPPRMRWRAMHDQTALTFCLAWEDAHTTPEPHMDVVRIIIQPDRLGPTYAFTASRQVTDDADDDLHPHRESRAGETRLTLTIPFHLIGDLATTPRERLRLHVSCFYSAITDPLCFSGKPLLNSWAPVSRTMPRNLFGYLDPAAFGWLLLDQP